MKRDLQATEATVDRLDERREIHALSADDETPALERLALGVERFERESERADFEALNLRACLRSWRRSRCVGGSAADDPWFALSHTPSYCPSMAARDRFQTSEP